MHWHVIDSFDPHHHTPSSRKGGSGVFLPITYPPAFDTLRIAAYTVCMPDDNSIPTTGPEAIMYALSQLDADGIEAEARQDLATKKRSLRSNAVKKLRIVEGLRRNKIQPKDFMITKVPVIPARYRPFAAQGDTLIPGDANVLYKDLFDVRDAHNEERKMFGDKFAGQSRLALYDAVKAVYGYGDPTNPKTRGKEITGFLKKITGKNAKFGFVQHKLMAKTQDNVGRSTVVVDPEYGVNEIGIPKSMAFVMYAPYIQRQLKRQGFSDVDALRHVKDRTPDAERALERVITERPVVYSRAPAWHAFSLNAGIPHLVDGDAIKVNPYVTTGMGMDFDGNCIIGRMKIVIRMTVPIESDTQPVHDAFDENSVKVCVDNTGNVGYTDPVMSKNTNMNGSTDRKVVSVIEIKDMPYLKDTERRDKNGAFVYDVPEGIEVLTSTPDKGARWEKVTTFTVEDGCRLQRVTTSRGNEVVCSSNESLAAFDPKGGLMRIKPDDAIITVMKKDKDGVEREVVDFAHAVPVIAKYPSTPAADAENDFEFGWFLGAFVSDGTYDGNIITYTKESDAMRAMFIDCIAKITGKKDLDDYVKVYRELHNAETNCGIGGKSVKIHIPDGLLTPGIRELMHSCYDWELRADTSKRSCLAKKLPDDIYTYSHAKLMGLLSGLIDGDGSISISHAKKNPQVLCNFCTSAPRLKDSVCRLFQILGIRYSVSTTEPKAGRVQKHTSYTIAPILEALAGYLDEVKTVNNYEGLAYLRDHKPGCSVINVTPMSYYAMQTLYKVFPSVSKEVNYWVAFKAKTKKYGYALLSRVTTKKIAELIKTHIPNYAEDPALKVVVDAAFDETTAWERYASVEEYPTETVYDIGVPGAKVFALESGLIVYDTINVHVPASDDAVKEAMEKLMPSMEPFGNREEGKIVHIPKQEQILGLYTAATAPSKRTVQFSSQEEAIAAIRKGQVSLSDDVTWPGMENEIGSV